MAVDGVRSTPDAADKFSSLPSTYALRAPDWQSGRAYVVGELVYSGSSLYRCTTAHTSGVSFDGTKFGQVSGAVQSVDGLTGAVTLSGTYGRLVETVRTPSVWGIGDSHTAGAGPGGGGVTFDAAVFANSQQGGLQYQGGSWIPWALLASGTRWTIRGFAATGGFTAAQILATHVPQIIAAATRGDVVVVHAGTNGNVLADTIAIHDALRAAGLPTVAVTIPPNTASTVSAIFAFNEGLKRYAQRNRIPIADVHGALVDPATGAYLSAYNGDGTHANQAGCQVGGQTIAATLNTLMPVQLGLVNHNAALTGSNQPNPLAQNALTNGTDYGLLTGLGTSTIAQGNVSGFGGGKGYVFTRGDTDINARLATWTLQAGRTYRVGMALSATVTSGNWGMRLESNTTGTKTLWGFGYPGAMTTSIGVSRFFSEFTVPAGGLPDYVYRLRIFVGSAGTVLNLGELSLLDLTALGAA